MSATVTDPAYLTDHGDACEEIGTLAWLLSEVVRLSDDSGGMTAVDPLREQLRHVAGLARDRVSVQRARLMVNSAADEPRPGGSYQRGKAEHLSGC